MPKSHQLPCLAVTVLQNVLVLAVIPAAIYALVTLTVMWPRLTRTRNRVGEEWEFAPVFWVANPAGVSTTTAPVADQDTAPDAQPATARGGARGNW